MSCAARLLDLFQALRRRRHAVPARELAAELGISVRTLYQDVATLVGRGRPQPVDLDFGRTFVALDAEVIGCACSSRARLNRALGTRWHDRSTHYRFAGLTRMAPNKFRLVTRSDFDGLVCGMLLRELNMIDEIKFVHPKDMQDGIVPITARDIVTNLPYVAGCHLAFDHHASEVLRVGERGPDNHVIDPSAPSAARVLFNHFGGVPAFPRVQPDLMAAVDQADSANFSHGDILNPQGWVLLNFLMDSRTGLGRFRDFRISNYDLMMQLIEHCRDHTIEEVLALPDVHERVELFTTQRPLFEEQLRRCTTVHGRLAMLDLREEEIIHAGNRFMIYAMFPHCDISVHVLWGVRKENTVFAIGKSILDRGSPINVGEVCLGYGGGGHEAAGTCQIANGEAERVKHELIDTLSCSPLRSAA